MSARWSRGETIRRFHIVMDGTPGFPEEEIDKIEELVQVGEWQIAFENLCTQLYEFGIVLPGGSLAMIAEIGREVGVEERYWSILEADA